MMKDVGTLLVIDDDGLNRMLLTTRLEEDGFVVEAAEDGFRALELMHERSFDVVLLDLLMPGMDGFQVLEHMKSYENLRHIPVIVISALDEMDSVIRCIEMGATDYLPKPFDPVLLRARLNASLADKRLRDMQKAYLEQIQVVGARLQAIFKEAAIGIALMDSEGRSLESNPALQSMLAYSGEELRGLPFSQFTHSEDRERDLALYRELMDGKREHYQIEKRYIRKDGQLIWGRQTVSLLRDVEGRPQYGISMVENVTERKRTEDKLKYVSIHDVLTGCYNRTYFEEEMSRLERGRSYPVSMFMIDVDGLKEANDKYGHSAGDDLLRGTATVLRSVFRAEDVVARVGGDEFAVVLPSTDGVAAGKILGRIRHTLLAYNSARNDLPISFSLGVSTAEKGQRFADVLKQADERMYQEKLTRPGRRR